MAAGWEERATTTTWTTTWTTTTTKRGLSSQDVLRNERRNARWTERRSSFLFIDWRFRGYKARCVVWPRTRVLIGWTNNPASRLIRDVFIPLTGRRRTEWRTGRSKGTPSRATNESDCSRWIELLMNYISLREPTPSEQSIPRVAERFHGPPSTGIHLCRSSFYFPAAQTDRLRFVRPLPFLSQHRLETMHAKVDPRKAEGGSWFVVRGSWAILDL